MSLSGVCAACRLRALIRQQSLSRQRRQRLSYSPNRSQNGQAGEYVDTLYEKFDRSLKQPQKARRAHSGGQYGSIGQQRVDRKPSRGRYSGRPLREQHEDAYQQKPADSTGNGRLSASVRSSGTRQRPQDMLEDLAVSHQRSPETRPREDGYQESAELIRGTEATNGPLPSDPETTPESRSHLTPRTVINLPEDVIRAAEGFMQTRDNDHTKWSSLQAAVAACRDVSDLQCLGKDRYFSRSLFYRTMKASDAFVLSANSPDAAPTMDQFPTPASLLQTRTATTGDPSTVWPYVLWKLARSAAELQVTGEERVPNATQRILQELMTVWSLCMKAQQQKGRENTQHLTLLQRPSIDFSFLPPAAPFRDSLQEHGSRHSLASILDFLVLPLSFQSGQKDFDYTSAALVTLDLLQDWKGPRSPEWEQWTTLMETVVKCVTVPKVPHALARAMAESHDDRTKSYFASLVDKFKLRAAPTSFSILEDSTSTQTNYTGSKHPLLQSLDRPPALTENSSDFDRYMFDAAKNLARALEQHKLVYAKRTWQKVLETAATYPNIKTPLYLYEFLLSTFLALRDQQTVVEVWQTMTRDGHQPTVKTYSIVMRGCSYVGDAQALEAFWSSMRKAGLQPDSHAWSTRVYSLLKSRQVDAGLRALGEMSQEWIAAARQAHERELPASTKQKKKVTSQIPSSQLAQRYNANIDGVPRPDQIVMNSAVSALASVNDQAIPKVLSWARSFGLEPDLTTYNVLLNLSMRHGQPDEALHILRRMETKGIQADGTTWTVLLTALFEGGFLNDLAPEVQQEKILTFISSLEASNAASIDMKGYALVIDRLLKHHANPAAADAVLKHMRQRKLQPTPHIYTIVMASYFDPPTTSTNPVQQPPNFRAIEALWSSIRAANAAHGVPLDAQFYDRMVEGYATHHVAAGSIKPMMQTLHRMYNEGKKPSWKALTCAVRALAEMGEWARAQDVVERVRREMEGSRATGQRFGQREFWGLCAELGLMEQDEGDSLAVAGTGRGALR